MARPGSAARASDGKDLFRKTSKSPEKEAKAVASPAVQFGEHGRYQIKSGWLAGTFVARAFPKASTRARGMIAEATGTTEEEAIAALHDIIDTREQRRAGERRTEPRAHVAVPSTEEYVEAIRQVALSQPQRAMLIALSVAAEDGLTGPRMASAAGYKSEAAANRSLTAAAMLIADYLSVEPHPRDGEADAESAAILGFRGDAAGERGAEPWILHPELRDAIREAL